MMQHLTSETLTDYLHHELPPGEDARVLAHLEGCAVCTRELNAEATITDSLRTLARTSELELPLGFGAAIMRRISSEETGPGQALRRWLSPLWLVPVAAAVAAAAFFFSPVLAPQNAHTAIVPVSYYLEQHAVSAQENPLGGDHGAIILSSLSSPVTSASNDGQDAR